MIQQVCARRRSRRRSAVRHLGSDLKGELPRNVVFGSVDLGYVPAGVGIIAVWQAVVDAEVADMTAFDQCEFVFRPERIQPQVQMYGPPHICQIAVPEPSATVPGQKLHVDFTGGACSSCRPRDAEEEATAPVVLGGDRVLGVSHLRCIALEDVVREPFHRMYAVIV